ncbi:uncharacterized protein LOC116445393 isoform X4 [Corvus moneduloides]|uniref:uncharacterized protein LOC116445393 isoform X4 n=1 Tax=Corvus moneduloides TaxID=1196302 RepID=UPI001362EF75|nr:uncharacterized protein LOC116445393 isoform X4 [Corvus moneduloides]
MDGPGRYLQWAGECLPLQEKQSRWPGLLEEQLKLSVGDKRDNELLPGSPGLFPNAIPWLCNLVTGEPGTGPEPELVGPWQREGSSKWCWRVFGSAVAKNIQNCLLTLMDSRNAFHSSCFGMGMAVGSSGRTRWTWKCWRRSGNADCFSLPLAVRPVKRLIDLFQWGDI